MHDRHVTKHNLKQAAEAATEVYFDATLDELQASHLSTGRVFPMDGNTIAAARRGELD